MNAGLGQAREGTKQRLSRELSLVDYEIANARLTTVTSFLLGISAVLLLLSINLVSGRYQQGGLESLVAGSVTIVSLLLAILLLLTCASTLTSAYYDKGVRIDVAVQRARRLAIVANVLIFIALAGLLLVAFQFTLPALLYATTAVLCSVVWLITRRRQKISF